MESVKIYPWDLEYPNPEDIHEFTLGINCHICNGTTNVKQGEITTEKTPEKRFWRLCQNCLNLGWWFSHRELVTWEAIYYSDRFNKEVQDGNKKSVVVVNLSTLNKMI